MKTIISCCLIMFQIVINAQAPDEYGLDKFNNVTEISPGVLKFIRPDGSSYIKRTKFLEEPKSEADLVIMFDTLTFAHDKYQIWKAADIEGSYKLILVDADHNGNKEMYGTYLEQQTMMYDGRIYEFTNSMFNNIFQFGDTLGAFKDMADIDNDGLLDAVATSFYHYNWHRRLMFYTQKNGGQLITKTKTIYDRFISQMDNVSLYDLDKDGEDELIYFLLVTQPQDSAWMGNHVAKYNKQTNNFELLFHHWPSPTYYTFGFSFGDFDVDGKNNFITGSSEGEIYIYEYVDSNQYRLEFKDSLYTLHAYMSTFTNDLDGNGKPELWIGSDFFSSVYGAVTRVFVFEAAGPDNYRQVYQIDIIGLFAFEVGNMRNADIDNDGKDEVLMYTAAYLFVFKRNEQGYYLDFVITDPKYGVAAYRAGFDVTDLDDDGKLELVFFYRSNPDSNTIFMKSDSIVNVEVRNNFIPLYNLNQNYPNPFNPSTKISYSLKDEGYVKLYIYDIKGELVSTLVNEKQQPGSYEVDFRLPGNISTGVYIYRLTVSDNSNNMIFSDVKKMVYLK